MGTLATRACLATMDRTQEYRRRAVDCRKMAATAPNPAIRGNYEELAAMWDKMADERLKFFVVAEVRESL